MTKKEKFIEEVEKAFREIEEFTLSEDALTYFEAMKLTKDKDEKTFTENGAKILSFMRENKNSFNNMFSAKSAGEAMHLSSRTVSGACRKLVTDGYLEKIGENPTIYTVTQKGMEVEIDSHESQN